MAEQGRDADAELAAFPGAAVEPLQFWQQIDANFAAGRIKMVFVADTIPRELARIVEFLNEQMKADVRAIELSWFEGANGVTALSPRVFGETGRAQSEKTARTSLPPIDREAWIADRLARHGSAAVEGAEVFLSMIEATGGSAEVTTAQGSLVAIYLTPGGKLYPMALVPGRTGSVQLYLGYLMDRPAFASEDARREVYEELVSIVGPLSTRKLNGYPSFNVTKLNDPVVRSGVETLLRKLVQMARAT